MSKNFITIEICNTELCSGCGVCYAVCPAGAISFTENDKGFLYPVINKEKCIKILNVILREVCEKICEVFEKFLISCLKIIKPVDSLQTDF